MLYDDVGQTSTIIGSRLRISICRLTAERRQHFGSQKPHSLQITARMPLEPFASSVRSLRLGCGDDLIARNFIDLWSQPRLGLRDVTLDVYFVSTVEKTTC